MPTNITQLDDPDRNKTVLRVKGEMSLGDAELLLKIALDLRSQSDKALSLDLADLDFLDSEAAPIIRKMEKDHGFEVEGLPFFVQKVVDETENRPG